MMHRVDWCGSLKLPIWARSEWAQEHSLPFFASQEFENNFNVVLRRGGVGTDAIKHNVPNQILIEGAKKLG